MQKYFKVLIALIAVQLAALAVSGLWMFNEQRSVTVLARMPNLQFKIGKDYVDVRHGGQSIQTIPFDPGALTDENRSFFLGTPDINFDGYPDLTLIFSQGLHNIYYDGWIFDHQERRFVYEPIIRTLASPVFDEKNKRIDTYEHGSATDHADGMWAYIDGRLTELGRVEQSYDEKSDLFTIRTYRLRDGQLKLTGEEQLTPSQLEERDQEGTGW